MGTSWSNNDIGEKLTVIKNSQLCVYPVETLYTQKHIITHTGYFRNIDSIS